MHAPRRCAVPAKCGTIHPWRNAAALATDMIGMVRSLFAGIAALAALASAACTTTAETQAVSAPTQTATAPTTPPGDIADRAVCVDLDARGGALYAMFVVPMMARAGQTSVNVDIQRMIRAVESVALVGQSSLDEATDQVADEGQRMVAAAEAFQAYDHAEGTALLTSFVGLAVACQQAGHKPSWFDATALAAN